MNRQSLNRTTEAPRAMSESNVKPKSHKYNAKPQTVKGIKFDSKAEAEYFLILEDRLKQGIIQNMILQPRYELQPRCILPDRLTVIQPIDYIADFQVTYPDGRVLVIDVKGKETELYRAKSKMFRARYPELTLRVVKKTKGGWDE